MIITTLLFSIIIVMMYLSSKNIKLNSITKLTINIFLIIYLGIRYDFGNDYLQYQKVHFSVHQNLNNYFTNNIEEIYLILNKFFKNFNLFVLILGIFYIIVINKLISRNLKKEDQWVAFLMLLLNPYLFLVHLSTFRQTIVICIFIISIKYLIKRDWKMYVLLVLLSTGFHKTGILLLPIYFIKSRLLKKYELIILAITLFFYIILNKKIIMIVIEKLFRGNKNYLFYLNSGNMSISLALIINICLLCVLLKYISRLKRKSDILIFKLSIITFVVYILSSKIPMLARIAMYFEIFTIIAFSKIYILIKNKQLKFIYIVSLISIYLFKYINFFNNSIWVSKYYYYKTIFDY